jgi:hypothetical protein
VGSTTWVQSSKEIKGGISAAWCQGMAGGAASGPTLQLLLSTANALLSATFSRPAHLYTLEQSHSREVVLAEVLAWLRFPAVHANVQGGIEYLEARLSPRMPGFFYLLSNSARTFFAADPAGEGCLKAAVC